MVSHNPDCVFIAVYMMARRRHGTLYIGVTSNLLKRVYEHRNNLIEGFTKRYSLHELVWYEQHETMASAIQRETSLKRYTREWKINLIESDNRYWEDLYPELTGERRIRKAVEALKRIGPRPS